MKKLRTFAAPCCITFLLLLAIEFPHSRFWAPVYAATESLSSLEVTGASQLEGAVNIGVVEGGQDVQINASSMRTNTSAGTIPGCDGADVATYGEGEVCFIGHPLDGNDQGAIRNVAPSGLTLGSYYDLTPFSCFVSTAYTQHWAGSAVLGLGDATTSGRSMTGAFLAAKDNTSNNARATLHLADSSGNGQAYLGVMREVGSADKLGASIEIDTAGNFIVTLPASGTGSETAAFTHAHANGLGVVFPKPIIPSP